MVLELGEQHVFLPLVDRFDRLEQGGFVVDRAGGVFPVSYTHLDVYKRQV